MNKMKVVAGVAIAAVIGCSTDVFGQTPERPGRIKQELSTTSDAQNWTTQNSEVPVCWETNGYDREKKLTRDAVTFTWEYWANVRFTGWAQCPGSGKVKQVRVRISPQGTDNAGAGGSARVGTAALSAADDNNPGVNLSFNPDGSANEGRVEYVAVHEFGHVLGFIHEQDAPGNEGPGQCAGSLDPHAQSITAYDRDSIMNYCNRDGNMTGLLTDADIAGVQNVYGARRKNQPSLNACASTPGKQMSWLAAPWNQSEATTIAVYPSDGTKFPGWWQWAIRDGGWMDSTRWVSGDFNGDGRSDLAAIWNYGGQNVLTVRPSMGNAFGHVHWLIGGGGWMDSTKWLSGDFNGDGKTDIAGVWNNGGKVSIAVFLSDGTKFPGWSQWTDQDGGWGDDVKWFSGDFNADGKTDIGAAWNNGGRTTLTVRLSQGNKFNHVHWSLDAGRWFNSSTFVVADFNGDGGDDVAQLWNDIGRNSIKVSLSAGTYFLPPVEWARRDGGWGDTIKWIPGDFNGDRRGDIAAIWNNGGSNTLTVRASDGTKFTPAHWLVNGGGWMDNTVWCSGRFQ